MDSGGGSKFRHLTRRGSVCGPTLRASSQLQDIYTLLPRVSGKPSVTPLHHSHRTPEAHRVPP